MIISTKNNIGDDCILITITISGDEIAAMRICEPYLKSFHDNINKVLRL
jgi:hypothetical protein